MTIAHHGILIHRKAAAFVGALLLCALFLVGCGGSGGGSESTEGPPFVRSDLRLNEYRAATGIDISNVSQGYVGAAAQSSSRLRFVVEKDGAEQVYEMSGDGAPNYYPLQAGDGNYTLSVMQNTRDNLYATIATETVSVALDNEFEPFLRPNYFCNYNANSESVKLANSLTEGSENEGEALASIYNWIVENISYDTDKATNAPQGYTPNPDATLSSRTGICFDYASLAAAMLRSQGIPCKIITGYVSDGNIYHAWNMVFIDGVWITMQMKISSNTWERIDTTFAAGGDSRFVGDGSAYTDRYIY